MDFNPSPAVESLLERIEAFMAEHVYPSEAEVMRALDDEVKPGVPYPQILIEIRAKAREEGLWNLFIADDEHGAGLTNWEYGMLCEQMGRSPVAAPMSFNCAAPDTGNAEILIDHGTPEQQARVPPAAAGGRGPQLLLDDRARGLGLGPDHAADPRRSSTATSGSSTATSGSPPAPSAPTSRSRWSSPTPTPPRTRGRA